RRRRGSAVSSRPTPMTAMTAMTVQCTVVPKAQVMSPVMPLIAMAANTAAASTPPTLMPRRSAAARCAIGSRSAMSHLQLSGVDVRVDDDRAVECVTARAPAGLTVQTVDGVLQAVRLADVDRTVCLDAGV